MNQHVLSLGQEYARILKESLFGKTGAKSFSYFYYAGGNKESRFDYFMKRFGDASLQPDFVEECECTHWIKENCYVEYMPNDRRCRPPKLFVVGNCCIRRFLPLKNQGKTCTDCRMRHKNRKDNYCTICREKRDGRRCNECGEKQRKSHVGYCKDCRTEYGRRMHENSAPTVLTTAPREPLDIRRFIKLTNPDEVDIRTRFVRTDASKCIWPFGKKYGGRFVQEIDRGYAVWAVQTIRPSTSNVQLALNYLEAKFSL
jgi:hypothetical protein